MANTLHSTCVRGSGLRIYRQADLQCSELSRRLGLFSDLAPSGSVTTASNFLALFSSCLGGDESGRQMTPVHPSLISGYFFLMKMNPDFSNSPTVCLSEASSPRHTRVLELKCVHSILILKPRWRPTLHSKMISVV